MNNEPKGLRRNRNFVWHSLAGIIIGLVLLLEVWHSNETVKQMAAPATNFFSTKLTMRIQPFADMPTRQAENVYQQIKKVYSGTVLLPPIQLPRQAYYPQRNRYRADSIIDWLSRSTPDGYVTLGLTTKDVSATKGRVADWGVMGLGFQPGNACVVSTFRLSKSNLADQLFKVSIHELGHTQGLPHCPDKTCYMQDAEGGNPTDQETGFCAKCRKVLESKGWAFDGK